MLLSRTIRLFLDGIGRREEYEFYLRKFQRQPGTCFALIATDLPCVEQAREVMMFDLNFLHRLELNPLLILAGRDASAMRELLMEDDYHFNWLGPDFDPHVLAESAMPCAVYAPDMEATTVMRRLMPSVSRRVHWVRMEGSLRDKAMHPVPFYYLNRSRSDDLHRDDRPLIRFGQQVLKYLPSAHVSITSPMNLLQEMFTVKGAGSVIRPGSVIKLHRDRDDLEMERLIELLESSFGKRLRTRRVLAKVSHFYVERHYRGAALLEQQPAGLYLSKFAVGTEARGEGLAQELWDLACEIHPALFWRSRASNPINQWYERRADGRQLVGDWVVFWRGINVKDIPSVIRYCTRRKPDFVEK